MLELTYKLQILIRLLFLNGISIVVGINSWLIDGDVPRSPSYGVYISQLIRFARVCSNVDDFNNRNLFLTAKLLKQGYRYHKIRKAFSKFYHRHSELIVKYNIGLKTSATRNGEERADCFALFVFLVSRVVERLFLAVPRGCLQFVIVVFPDHTHLLFIQYVTNLTKLAHA